MGIASIGYLKFFFEKEVETESGYLVCTAEGRKLYCCGCFSHEYQSQGCEIITIEEVWLERVKQDLRDKDLSDVFS